MLTLSGVKGKCGRLRESGYLGRTKGSGPPKVARADAIVEEARELTIGSMWGGVGASRPPRSQLANPKITCGDAAKELGSSGSTARRLLKGELDCKPSRKTRSQRVKPLGAQKRWDCCRAWLAQIESGELDPRGICWAARNCLRSGLAQGEIRIWRFA